MCAGHEVMVKVNDTNAHTVGYACRILGQQLSGINCVVAKYLFVQNLVTLV